MNPDQERYFKSMFSINMDSFEVITPNCKTKIQILEYTVNIDHKRMKNLSDLDQQAKLLEVTRKGLKDIPHKEEVYYFEPCKDKVWHIHGKVTLEGNFYVEGVVQTFAKQVLRAIDGRLKYDKYGYYPSLQRYRSPTVCVQYTQDLERKLYWDQYITKSLKE